MRQRSATDAHTHGVCIFVKIQMRHSAEQREVDEITFNNGHTHSWFVHLLRHRRNTHWGRERKMKQYSATDAHTHGVYICQDTDETCTGIERGR